MMRLMRLLTLGAEGLIPMFLMRVVTFLFAGAVAPFLSCYLPCCGRL